MYEILLFNTCYFISDMEKYIRVGSALEIPRYDCRVTGLTQEQYLEKGTTNYFIGIPFIIFGLIAEVIYVLVMMVMSRPEHIRFSCYKIMLVLGIYDMAAIALNSILTGYFWLIGASYCSCPDLMYISGAIALGLWCGACLNCFVLVINRLLDLWKPYLMERVFGGNKTYFILLIPLCYSLYFTFFTEPLLFNSRKTAWFFDPFIMDHEDEMFINIPHTANNLLIVVMTCSLYGFLCYILLNKFKSEFTRITWAQKSIFIQSTLICLANLVAALIYVYMQFFPTPPYLVLIGHVSWQFGHGFPAIVYIALNRTIQKDVLKLIRFRHARHINSIQATTVTTNNMI